ncbi:MAG: PhoH family protein [Bacilli bacterium]
MNEWMETLPISFQDVTHTQTLFGTNDAHLARIEEQLAVTIVTRGDAITVSGEEPNVKLAVSVLAYMIGLVEKRMPLGEREVMYAIRLAQAGRVDALHSFSPVELCKNYRGKSIRPKTIGQQMYIDSQHKCDIVFGVGPAGTGKTYLAVAMGVVSLKQNRVKKIILTRPAVEAGENLGFLPGDLKEKVDPYLRPLYDALHDLLGAEHTERMIERGLIEIAPLAYMRGRTLDDAFIILDEAQNTTPAQMKMFLTRLGFGSKMVITGDPSQVDLPKNQQSGLAEVTRILAGVPGIAFHFFEGVDVVRHPLVQRVIDAYDEYSK